MKRVKTKAKRNKKYTLSDRQLDKVKHDVSQQITDRVFLLFLAATSDELGLSEAQIVKLAKRFQNYAGYIDKHVAQMGDIQKAIEKNTGVKLIGW